MTRYVLRIMDPGSSESVFDEFVSDAPFGAISVGDFIDATGYSVIAGPRDEPFLRVVRVEHKFVSEQGAGPCHHIQVLTEQVRR
jgi:hypothetical protein